jgi:hypothetical protein
MIMIEFLSLSCYGSAHTVAIPRGTAVTAFILGTLVRGENFQWRKPLACGVMCHVSDHVSRVGSWVEEVNDVLGCARLCTVATPTRGAKCLLVS